MRVVNDVPVPIIICMQERMRERGQILFPWQDILPGNNFWQAIPGTR